MEKKRRRTPQEKKQLSLAKDRRNTFGEDNKSARRNLPKAKARPHRANRRADHAVLATAEGIFASELFDAAEQQLKGRRRKVFKKSPDEPLGDVLARKAARREWLAETAPTRRAQRLARMGAARAARIRQLLGDS